MVGGTPSKPPPPRRPRPQNQRKVDTPVQDTPISRVFCTGKPYIFYDNGYDITLEFDQSKYILKVTTPEHDEHEFICYESGKPYDEGSFGSLIFIEGIRDAMVIKKYYIDPNEGYREIETVVSKVLYSCSDFHKKDDIEIRSYRKNCGIMQSFAPTDNSIRGMAPGWFFIILESSI